MISVAPTVITLREFAGLVPPASVLLLPCKLLNAVDMFKMVKTAYSSHSAVYATFDKLRGYVSGRFP